MIEQAPMSQDLRDTIARHGKLRVGQVRELLARHPDVGVRDLDTAAELIVLTVEINTHKFMADPRTTTIEPVENELVDMVTRYLRGSRWTRGQATRIETSVPPLYGTRTDTKPLAGSRTHDT
ncbi:hypothetical protein [Nocardia jiangxiensis]|uniref:hypothetical protein n=1 Tax=Nocardia jiangxiensis TaxID=282685 RepID=UPI0002FD252C|nr:hypothetical protein [Nocardia jiangxiensis]